MITPKFYYKWLNADHWEVIMERHSGGRGSHQNSPRRIALCTHEDDAKCIAEAMDKYENATQKPFDPPTRSGHINPVTGKVECHEYQTQNPENKTLSTHDLRKLNKNFEVVQHGSTLDLRSKDR